MPRLTVWFLRTALVHLACGFTFGALILFHKGIPLDVTVWRLLPLHIEFVLIGWTVQLAMGVAFWILPRLIRGPARGNERLIWLAYAAFNGGVLAAATNQFVSGWGWGLLTGRMLEALAVAIFAVSVWPRVKAIGQ